MRTSVKFTRVSNTKCPAPATSIFTQSGRSFPSLFASSFVGSMLSSFPAMTNVGTSILDSLSTLFTTEVPTGSHWSTLVSRVAAGKYSAKSRKPSADAASICSLELKFTVPRMKSKMLENCLPSGTVAARAIPPRTEYGVGS